MTTANPDPRTPATPSPRGAAPVDMRSPYMPPRALTAAELTAEREAKEQKSVLRLLRRYKWTIIAPTLTIWCIYADWQRTQRDKASRAAQTALPPPVPPLSVPEKAPAVAKTVATAARS
ncbi:uncharacterized protein LOC129595730 [Paramacrobiotus metropolitanus]|uniref:uncharacterized protein LOC129595730 n=1 Tax=Paramacrobiotus metropolitanus TaxID=2943436 RepID=UPI002445DCFC|nr:uncharacterized protein LOC129595730 [Paramacrobiotus metropolitanus]